MNRRSFIGTVAAGLLAAPLAAEAQQAGKAHRIGILTLVSAPPFEDVFRQTLKDQGYVDGRNITLEWRRADGRRERLGELAADLVGLRMDVIVTASNDAALAAKAATTTIPIVMAAVGNPEQRGLVASLSRPAATSRVSPLTPARKSQARCWSCSRRRRRESLRWPCSR